MNETNCPICYGALDVRNVAPCDKCGAIHEELDHALQNIHDYNQYELFPGLMLTLCNVCALEIDLIDPSYFGLKTGTKFGFGRMRLVRSIKDIHLKKDKFCPACSLRLSFLRFVEAVRASQGS